MTMQRYGLFGWCLVVGAACGDADHRLGEDPNGDGGDSGASSEPRSPQGGDGAEATGGTPPTGGRAATGGTPNSAGDAAGTETGGSGSSTPEDDLSGVWDVVGTARGGTSMFVVSLSESTIIVNAQTFMFNVLADGDGFDVGYSYRPESLYGEEATLVVTNNGNTPFALGAFPIELGGFRSIRAVNSTEGCSSQLDSDTMVMLCSDVSGPVFMTDVRSSSLFGTRGSRAASRFGDLGGEWGFVGPFGTSCSLSVKGGEISGSCNSSRGIQGFNAVFEGDDASGSGTDGFEFSAHRR